MDRYFYLISESLGSSEEMVTIGGRRRMEELLLKHMNALRYVKRVSICYMDAFYTFVGLANFQVEILIQSLVYF